MRRTRFYGPVVAGVLLGLFLTGCGGGAGPVSGDSSPVGDIPDNQVFVTYTPPPGGCTIKVPEGWTNTSHDGAVSFTDKLNTITVASTTAATAPSEASARHDLETIKATTPGFAGGEVSTVTRPAGPGILLTYRGDAPPDPVTGKIINDDIERYQFFHAGLAVTLTLSGPHGADNVDPWRTVTDSLSWTS